MIHIESDWDSIDREIDRIASMPGPKTKALLDTVLDTGFALTQAAVHVQTGSLKSSGDKKSDIDKFDKKWEGEIQYGGPSLGPNNPVDYAIYEKRRGVGGAGGASDAKGDHDFMAGLPALHPAWIAAVKGALKG